MARAWRTCWCFWSRRGASSTKLNLQATGSSGCGRSWRNRTRKSSRRGLRCARRASGLRLSLRSASRQNFRSWTCRRCEFLCQFEEQKPQETGLDLVRFLMSANVGEALRPMAKVASGGELARIMLAMKNVLAEQDAIPTLIFDEVDAGVSGRAAQKVAEKLWAAAQAGKQVLCVTHLPQIAAMADRPVYRGKARGGRTDVYARASSGRGWARAGAGAARRRRGHHGRRRSPGQGSCWQRADKPESRGLTNRKVSFIIQGNTVTIR